MNWWPYISSHFSRSCVISSWTGHNNNVWLPLRKLGLCCFYLQWHVTAHLCQHLAHSLSALHFISFLTDIVWYYWNVDGDQERQKGRKSVKADVNYPKPQANTPAFYLKCACSCLTWVSHTDWGQHLIEDCESISTGGHNHTEGTTSFFCVHLCLCMDICICIIMLMNVWCKCLHACFPKVNIHTLQMIISILLFRFFSRLPWWYIYKCLLYMLISNI